MLKRVDLIQGSPDWEKWRDTGVGSSDVKVILRESKYKTLWELWAEKRGIKESTDFSRNPHIKRGNFFEPKVRTVLERKFGCALDVFCAEDAEYPHRKVSFDAVSPDSIPSEIKCPDTKMWNDLVQKGRKSEVFLTYVDQLLYQIGMLGAEYGYLVFFYHETSEMKIFKVIANAKRFSQICKAIDEFCINHLFTGNEPELDKNRDSYQPTDEEVEAHEKEVIELLEILSKESELKKAMDELKEQRDKATKKVCRIASKYKSLNIYGLKINTIKASPRFDYKQYIKDRADVEITDADRKRYSTYSKMSFRFSSIGYISWEQRKTEHAQRRMDRVAEFLRTGQVEEDEPEMEILF